MIKLYVQKYWIYFILILIISCNKKQERYIVVSKVKSVLKLATTETQLDKIVLGTQDRKLLGIVRINTARFVAYTQATVTAGIDLNDLRPEDVKIDDKSIKLDLPHVKVLNFSYPFNSFKIDSSITENAFLNTIDLNDQEYFFQQSEIDIRNNLKFTGIKSATEDKTRILMTHLLKNLGYEEIYITFKNGNFIEEIDMKNDSI